MTEDGSLRGGIAANVVVGAADECRVGVLPQEYDQFRQILDGRLIQVVENYAHSTTPRKQQKAANYSGLCVGIIIDNPQEAANDAINARSHGYMTDSDEETRAPADRLEHLLTRPRREREIERRNLMHLLSVNNPGRVRRHGPYAARGRGRGRPRMRAAGRNSSRSPSRARARGQQQQNQRRVETTGTLVRRSQRIGEQQQQQMNE